jgi:hypothetical protein
MGAMASLFVAMDYLQKRISKDVVMSSVMENLAK